MDSLKKNITLMMVEDDLVYQKRLSTALELIGGIEFVYKTDSGKEALQWLKEKKAQPDIILMDIHLKDISGIETCKLVKENYPEIEIMMLTVFEDSEKMFKSIQNGATGYVLKADSIQFIYDSITELYQGGSPLSTNLAKSLFDFVKEHRMDGIEKEKQERKAHPTNIGFESLSARELEILKLLVDGKTYTDIANQAYLSPHTVRSHIKNIYRKIHVNSRALAVRVALKNRLV